MATRPVVRSAFTLSTALVLLLTVVVGTAAAGSGRSSDPPVTVDARHAGLLNRTPFVATDARHAALVINAGALPRVTRPVLAGDPVERAPGRGSAPESSLVWIEAGIGAGIALLTLGGAAFLLARRRKTAVA